MRSAVADFDRAVRLDPDAAHYLLRAEAREGADDLDGAFRDYQDAARIDPKSAAAFNAQGQIWRRKGDMDKAIAAYDRSIAVDERPALGYRLRAEAYIAKGDRKRA